MSHEIETYGSKAAFFSARVDPWHKLGTVTPDALTAEDALKTAHLDWTVEKMPMTVPILTPDGVESLEVPEKFANVRINPFTGKYEVLGVVGRDYTVVQNAENAEFINAIVQESGAHFTTAGSLRCGRQVFITMKAPESLLIAGTDAVDQYIVATNSHDGTKAFQVAVTPTRVVCANTLRMALKGAKASFTTRHTKNAKERVAEAQKALGVMWDYSKHFEETANQMAQQKITDAEFEAIVESLFPESKEATERQQNQRTERLGAVNRLYHEAPTQDGFRGTKWGAYNALTEYVDWQWPVRGGDEARAERVAVGGWTDKVKQDAFTALAAA